MSLRNLQNVLRSLTRVSISFRGKVAVSWLKILAANSDPNPTILSHETAT